MFASSLAVAKPRIIASRACFDRTLSRPALLNSKKNITFSRLVAVAGAVALWVLCGGAEKSSSLDLESHKFVDDAIVAIASSWNPDELLKRASSEMLAEAGHQVDVDSLFDQWRPLGGLISYTGSTGGAETIESPEIGKMIKATYSAKATFQNGTAEIRIELVKRDGHWSILGFKVSPNLKENHGV